MSIQNEKTGFLFFGGATLAQDKRRDGMPYGGDLPHETTAPLPHRVCSVVVVSVIIVLALAYRATAEPLQCYRSVSVGGVVVS